MEIWKDVPIFGNKYQASNLGNIRTKAHVVKKYSPFFNKIIEQNYKQRELKPVASKDGYYRVHLGVNGEKKSYSVHRMVLMAFVGIPLNGYEGCHNNGIPSDNRIENLRWGTKEENAKDRIKHGTYKRGAEHHMYGTSMNQKLKEKLIKFHTGRKASEETKRKMTESQKKRWANVSKQKVA